MATRSFKTSLYLNLLVSVDWFISLQMLVFSCFSIYHLPIHIDSCIVVDSGSCQEHEHQSVFKVHKPSLKILILRHVLHSSLLACFYIFFLQGIWVTSCKKNDHLGIVWVWHFLNWSPRIRTAKLSKFWQLIWSKLSWWFYKIIYLEVKLFLPFLGNFLFVIHAQPSKQNVKLNLWCLICWAYLLIEIIVARCPNAS